MAWLKIVTSNELVRIPTDEIVFIAAAGNYCEIHLSDGGKHTMTFQLHYFEEYFNQHGYDTFFRVGRSLIVNKKHIRIINVNDRTIKFGGPTISESVLPLADNLGRDTLRELKKEMTTYEDRN